MAWPRIARSCSRPAAGRWIRLFWPIGSCRIDLGSAFRSNSTNIYGVIRLDANKAVVLISGGLDSSTTLAIAQAEGYVCYGLTVDYGQRHRSELDAARRVAERLGVRDHKVIKLDLTLGGSALTDPPLA